MGSHKGSWKPAGRTFPRLCFTVSWDVFCLFCFHLKLHQWQAHEATEQNAMKEAREEKSRRDKFTWDVLKAIPVFQWFFSLPFFLKPLKLLPWIWLFLAPKAPNKDVQPGKEEDRSCCKEQGSFANRVFFTTKDGLSFLAFLKLHELCFQHFPVLSARLLPDSRSLLENSGCF